MSRRAVFIDRDGTINEEIGYLHRPEDCRMIDGASRAIAELNRAGFTVVVVTNQSGIARGYYSAGQMHKLHEFMAAELASESAVIDAWYYCPHHPGYPAGASDCDCRKPSPGMLIRAAEELDLDLSGSWMVGDKLADLAAGKAAGCRSILVMTGHGFTEAPLAPPDAIICADIFAAAQHIIKSTD